LWIPTFASQAGGILPNLIFPTRLPQFLIMFLVLLLPVGLWLIQRTASEVRRAGSWKTVVAIAIGLPLALFLLSWVLAGVVTVAAPDFVQSGLIGLGASSLSELAAVSVARRLDAPSVAVLLSLVLALGYLFLRRAALGNGGDGGERSLDVFAVLMVILGAALVLVPEFFYLRDSFGTRMNTVFKFYYAAWLLWAMAAAYMLAWPWESFGRWGRPLLVVAVLPLILGLIYTTTALWEKTSQFSVTGGPQLDGTAHLDLASPQDANAIRWMRAALTPAVVAEAVGGSYTQYGRISAHTGFPTVLGWEFHEYQWRGDWTPQGTRNQDIARLYTSKDWQEAQSILERYDIRYVYVGPLERSTYTPVATAKFDLYMTKLYEQGDVTIYGRREQVGA
jgi:YYY domain-containing protein